MKKASLAISAKAAMFSALVVAASGAGFLYGPKALWPRTESHSEARLEHSVNTESNVADTSGQFAMTPPQLPSDSHKPARKSTSPDGKVTQSASNVLVSDSKPVALPPQVAAADADIDTTAKEATNGYKTQGPTSPDAASQAAAVQPPEEGSQSAREPASSGLNRVVSRGDSLWRISRETYGNGTDYALIYRANRDKIRNPHLIYPGQSFALPKKQRAPNIRKSLSSRNKFTIRRPAPGLHQFAVHVIHPSRTLHPQVCRLDRP